MAYLVRQRSSVTGRVGFAAAILLALAMAVGAAAASARPTVTIGSLPFPQPGYGVTESAHYVCDGARLGREDPSAPSYLVPALSNYGANPRPVITSWTTTGMTATLPEPHQPVPVTSRLVVFRPQPPSLYSNPVVVAISRPHRVAPNTVRTFHVHIPVQPGDEIGIASTGACAFTSALPGDAIVLYSRRRPLVVGELAVPTDPGFYANRPNVRATVAFRPDRTRMVTRIGTP